MDIINKIFKNIHELNLNIKTKSYIVNNTPGSRPYRLLSGVNPSYELLTILARNKDVSFRGRLAGRWYLPAKICEILAKDNSIYVRSRLAQSESIKDSINFS